MKHSLKNRINRAGIALAVAAAFTAFGAGAALAATFTSANITIATQTNEAKEIAAGDLVCSWRETGLGPFQVVSYNCGAQAVAVVEACVYKGRIISATQTSVFTNVIGGEHGEGAVLLANAQGRINGSTSTAPGEGEGGHGLCPEIGEVPGGENQAPAVEVVAVRWCNASLTDITNNLVGATVTDLFAVFQRGTFTMPTCAEMLLAPATP